MKKYKIVFQPHPKEPVKIMEIGAMNIPHLLHRCEKDFSIDVNKITVIKQIITKDETKRLITMLNSPDDQDKNLAREIILKKIK